MSDSTHQDPNRSLPDGIPAPPPPKPNIIDPSKSGPTYAFGTTEVKKGRGKTERTHPTDPYEPLKKRKGCGGCCGCLGGSLLLVVVLFIGVVAAVTYYGPGRFVKDGYTVVNLANTDGRVTTAPTEPTVYIGTFINYNVGVTEVPIAIIGQEVIISGTFLKEVSLTGSKVTALANSSFAGDLEVFAAEFFDKGISLTGELKGRVMRSLQ